MLTRKQLQHATLLGMACAAILFSAGLIVGYALWSVEQELGGWNKLNWMIEAPMFIPVVCGLRQIKEETLDNITVYSHPLR